MENWSVAWGELHTSPFQTLFHLYLWMLCPGCETIRQLFKNQMLEWAQRRLLTVAAYFLSHLSPVRSTVFLATIQQDQENSMACTRILYPELSNCQWNSCCNSFLVPQYQMRLHHVLEDINHNFWAIFLFVLYPPLTRGKVHDHFIIQ